MTESYQEESEFEWLSWHQTMRIMNAAGINYPWKVLPSWLAEGTIESRATAIIGAGRSSQNSPLIAAFWDEVRNNRVHISAFNGTLQTAVSDPEEADGKLQPVSIVGPQVRKDQLLALVPHVPAKDIEAAISAEGEWLGSKKKVGETPVIEATPEPAKGKRGRKLELDRWQAFYFAAIELAKSGQLTVARFGAPAELRDELLEMMGDGAWNPDYADPFVGQIYRKFVEGD